jgi:hypothetical protein
MRQKPRVRPKTPPLVPQLARVAEVVAVVRVAAVDDDVARLEVLPEALDRVVDVPGRHHEPDDAGRLELRDDVGGAGGADRAALDGLRDRVEVHVVRDDLVPVPHQPGGHVGPHPTQPDHRDPHACHPCRSYPFVIRVSLAARSSPAGWTGAR